MSTEPHLILVNPDVRNRNFLSLGYVGAFARSRGFGVDVVDFCGGGVSPAGFRRLLRDRRPLLVGLGAYQQTMAQVIEVSRIVRAHSDAKIILGGPQAWGMPEMALAELPEVDFLCRGEGEHIAASLLRALQRSDGVDELPGISVRLPDGRIRTNPNPAVPTDLDEYPSPYLTGTLRLLPGSRALLLSSRGCVFDCAFCMTPMMSGRTIRFHSIERVVQEMSCLYDQGVDDIWFADPLFSFNRARMHALFSRILGLGLPFKIWCETRPELVDRETIELMREAGVTEISVGLESTGKAALKRMGKRQSPDRVTRLVRTAEAQGITVNLMHIVGAPGDTYSSILRTFDYIRGLGILMGANNRGNAYSVYFGTRDHAALSAGTLGADWVAPSEHDPSYLSPGSRVRSGDLSEEDREKLAIRQRSEHNLADVLKATEDLSQLVGLSANQALRVPAQRIMELRDLFVRQASRSREGQDRPVDRLILDGRDGARTSEFPGPIEETLDELTYDGVVFVLGRGESLLCDERLVCALRRRLTPEVLSAVTIIFSFDIECWRAHRSTLLQSLKRLPLASRPPTGPDSPAAPARVLALLDVSDGKVISPADLDQVRAELGRHEVDTYPFVTFDAGHPPCQWMQWACSLGAGVLLRHPVFVGAATGDRLTELAFLFEGAHGPTDMPALVMVNGDVLVGGGRYKARHMEKPGHGIHWIGGRPAANERGRDGLSF